MQTPAHTLLVGLASPAEILSHSALKIGSAWQTMPEHRVTGVSPCITQLSLRSNSLDSSAPRRSPRERNRGDLGLVLFSFIDPLCDLSFGFRTLLSSPIFACPLQRTHFACVLHKRGLQQGQQLHTAVLCWALQGPAMPFLLPHVGPLCRSRVTYFILKMAVSQEQKPCAERTQEGLISFCVPLSPLPPPKAWDHTGVLAPPETWLRWRTDYEHQTCRAMDGPR